VSDMLRNAPDRQALAQRVRDAGLGALQKPGAGRQQRFQAAFLLVELGDTSATPTVVDALTDPTPLVRQHAAYLLARTGDDQRAVTALIAALQDPVPLVQGTAHDSLRSLAEQGNTQAKAALEQYHGATFQQRLAR